MFNREANDTFYSGILNFEFDFPRLNFFFDRRRTIFFLVEHLLPVGQLVGIKILSFKYGKVMLTLRLLHLP